MDVVGSTEDAVLTGQHGGPRLDHEVSRAAWNVKRIIRLQRNKDEVVTTLGDEIEAVIEELAEECEPGVERRREAHIRRLIREEEDGGVIGGAENLIQSRAGDDLYAVLEDIVRRVKHTVRTRIVSGRIGRRIINGLVDDQIADHARLRVKDQAAGLIVRCT